MKRTSDDADATRQVGDLVDAELGLGRKHLAGERPDIFQTRHINVLDAREKKRERETSWLVGCCSHLEASRFIYVSGLLTIRTPGNVSPSYLPAI